MSKRSGADPDGVMELVDQGAVLFIEHFCPSVPEGDVRGEQPAVPGQLEFHEIAALEVDGVGRNGKGQLVAGFGLKNPPPRCGHKASDSSDHASLLVSMRWMTCLELMNFVPMVAS